MAIAALTIIGTVTAKNDGCENMVWLMTGKILQRRLMAVLTPAFNGITLGIEGAKGITRQVS